MGIFIALGKLALVARLSNLIDPVSVVTFVPYSIDHTDFLNTREVWYFYSFCQWVCFPSPTETRWSEWPRNEECGDGWIVNEKIKRRSMIGSALTIYQLHILTISCCFFVLLNNLHFAKCKYVVDLSSNREMGDIVFTRPAVGTPACHIWKSPMSAENSGCYFYLPCLVH